MSAYISVLTVIWLLHTPTAAPSLQRDDRPGCNAEQLAVPLLGSGFRSRRTSQVGTESQSPLNGAIPGCRHLAFVKFKRRLLGMWMDHMLTRRSMQIYPYLSRSIHMQWPLIHIRGFDSELWSSTTHWSRLSRPSLNRFMGALHPSPPWSAAVMSAHPLDGGLYLFLVVPSSARSAARGSPVLSTLVPGAVFH